MVCLTAEPTEPLELVGLLGGVLEELQDAQQPGHPGQVAAELDGQAVGLGLVRQLLQTLDEEFFDFVLVVLELADDRTEGLEVGGDLLDHGADGRVGLEGLLLW